MIKVIESLLAVLIVCGFTGIYVSAYTIDRLQKQMPSRSDVPLKRKARVWTDENFACILRHCKQHQPGSSPYLNCLSENCRRGMLAVERDLEYVQYNENSLQDNSLLDLESFVPSNMIENAKQTNPKSDINNYIGACYKKYCPGEMTIQDAVTCILEKCDSEQGNDAGWLNKMSQKSKRRMDSLMTDLATLYDEEPTYRTINSRSGGESVDSVESRSLQIVRKRRVNDEVSQCIQSYCGADAPVDRVFCIVKHCHRSRSVYK